MIDTTFTQTKNIITHSFNSSKSIKDIGINQEEAQRLIHFTQESPDNLPVFVLNDIAYAKNLPESAFHNI